MRTRERWATRVGLVLAMAGNAVGLGNFLRFPAQAAQNGGGAFLIPYLVSFVLMGIPLLWVEWAMGRFGGQFGHHSAPGMFDRLGRGRWLKYVGVFGIFGNVAIAAYYCYVESWTLAYAWHSIAGTFREVPPSEFFPDYLGLRERSLLAMPAEAVGWFLLTLSLNVWLLSKGIARGIERATRIGMPLLLLFGLALALRGLTLDRDAPGVVESPLVGLNFVWQPQLGGLTDARTWMAAAGQVFFTLSLGMGSIQCYASYLRRDEDVALNAASAGWMNEFVEVILGGTILIPIATAYLGLHHVQEQTLGGSGFSLAFLSLPALFQNWGWLAPLAGAMWFGLLFFAGITSSLAMGQPVLAFLEDELDLDRRRSTLAFGASTALLGLYCVWLYPGGAFEEFDFWTGTFGLVLFALLEVLVFVHVFGRDRAWEEITRGADIRVPRVYRFILAYVTPSFILAIFVGSLVQPSVGWGRALRLLFDGQGWPLAPGSIVGTLLHVGDDEYAWFDAGGDPTSDLVRDVTRLLLLAVIAACAWLVHLAWRRKSGRPS